MKNPLDIFKNDHKICEFRGVEKLLKKCLQEQLSKKKPNFIRVYDDEDGNTWKVEVKFTK